MHINPKQFLQQSSGAGSPKDLGTQILVPIVNLVVNLIVNLFVNLVVNLIMNLIVNLVVNLIVNLIVNLVLNTLSSKRIDTKRRVPQHSTAQA